MNNRILLQAHHERIIGFNPIYVDITGSHVSALLLSQICYWWKVTKNKEFYKTNEEFCEELRMGEKAFKNAKKNLIDLGFIKISVRGVPPVTYYQVDLDAIAEAIIASETNNDANWCERDQLNGPENPIGAKGTNCSVPNEPNIYRTETTTEITNLSKSFPKSKRESKTKLPEDIQLSEEWRSYILGKGIHSTQVDRLWDQFKEHYLANGDTMANWKAALGKWCSSQYSDWARDEKKDGVSPKAYGNYKTPELLNKLPSFNKPEFVDRVSADEGLQRFGDVLKAIGASRNE